MRRVLIVLVALVAALASLLLPEGDRMARPTVTVEVAFTTDPLSTSPSWTDITAYVRSWQSDQGRSFELDAFRAGQASIVLDNTDRRFDPLNASGPYYGNLLPRKRVRVSAVWNSTTYRIFDGYVDGWPQSYAPPASATVTLKATDALALVAQSKLKNSPYEAEVLADSPIGFWRLDETIGTTAKDSSGNGRNGTYTYDQAGNTRVNTIRADGGTTPQYHPTQSSGQSDGNFTVPEGTLGAISYPFTVEFAFKANTLYKDDTDATYTQIVYTTIGHTDGTNIYFYVQAAANRTARVGVASGSAYSYSSLNVNDDTWHHVVIRVTSASTRSIYIDGTSYGTTGSGTFPSSFPSGLTAFSSTTLFVPGLTNWEPPTGSSVAYSDLAIYSGTLGTSRITAHYNAWLNPWADEATGTRAGRILDAIGWPSGLYDLDTGNTTVGRAVGYKGTDALTLLNKVASTESGAVYVDHTTGKVRFRERDKVFTASRSLTVQMAFTDASGGTYRYSDPALTYDETAVINQVKVKWLSGEETVEDTASQATYGIKAKDVTTELRTAAEAQALGEWILARYKDATWRLRSLRLEAGADNRLFDALALQIGDRVSVRMLPQNSGSAFTRELLVEGISHNHDPGTGRWDISLRLSETDSTSYWIWDTSTWDETTRWGY